VAGLPAFLGIATVFYLLAELVLGGVFIAVAMRFLKTRATSDARRLFITSIIYLPLLLGAPVLGKACTRPRPLTARHREPRRLGKPRFSQFQSLRLPCYFGCDSSRSMRSGSELFLPTERFP